MSDTGQHEPASDRIKPDNVTIPNLAAVPTNERQANDVEVAVHVLNRMLELERPISIRIA